MVASLPIADPWPLNNRLAVQVDKSKTFHAYVHIPFCVVRCGYCDFNTYTASEIGDVSQSDFHRHLISEIHFSRQVLESSSAPARELSSIFFGGGTPSLFTPTQIREIIDSLRENFGLSAECEITLEANPEGLSHSLIEGFKDAGVNRISLGVQSFDQDVLRILDRIHTQDKVLQAVEAARSLGLRLSVDLIYGAPGESLSSWEKTLNHAISHRPEHVSAYSLIVEDGTALARKIKRGELAEVDEDLNAEKYLLTEQLLSAAGLANYEVSNWGTPSRHNQAYWQSNDWWGYGPGAHSHISGTRFWNHKHPANYAQLVSKGSPVHSMEVLDERTKLEERLLLEMRTSAGVPNELLKALGVSPRLIAEAIANGLLVLRADRNLVATLQGRLVVDGLVLDFLTK